MVMGYLPNLVTMVINQFMKVITALLDIINALYCKGNCHLSVMTHDVSYVKRGAK